MLIVMPRFCSSGAEAIKAREGGSVGKGKERKGTPLPTYLPTLVNGSEFTEFGQLFRGLDFGEGGRERGLPVVHVADGPHVDIRLAAAPEAAGSFGRVTPGADATAQEGGPSSLFRCFGLGPY